MPDVEQLARQIDRQLDRQSTSIDRMADSMTELAKTVARSEEKHQNTDLRLNTHSRKIEDHETRMRKAEAKIQSNSTITGGASKTVWAAGLALIGAFFTYLFKTGG
mgnify:CR=1 FL=1